MKKDPVIGWSVYETISYTTPNDSYFNMFYQILKQRIRELSIINDKMVENYLLHLITHETYQYTTHTYLYLIERALKEEFPQYLNLYNKLLMLS